MALNQSAKRAKITQEKPGLYHGHSDHTPGDLGEHGYSDRRIMEKTTPHYP